MIKTMPSEEDANIALDAIGSLNTGCANSECEGLRDPIVQDLAVNKIRTISASSGSAMPSEEDANIVLNAIRSLDTECAEPECQGLRDPIVQDLAINKIRTIGASSGSFASAARCIRTILFLRAYEGQLSDSTRQQLLAICGRLRKVKNFDLFFLATTLASRLMNDDQDRLLAHIKPLLRDWREFQELSDKEPGAPLHPTTLSVMLRPTAKWELGSLLELLDFASWSGTATASATTVAQGDLALKQIIVSVLGHLRHDIRTRCDSTEAQYRFQRLLARFSTDSDMAIFVPLLWAFVQTYQNELSFMRELDETPFGTTGPVQGMEMRVVLNIQLLRATSLLAQSGRCLQNPLNLDRLLQSFDIDRMFTNPWHRHISFGCGKLFINAGKNASAHWSPTLNRLAHHIIQDITDETPDSLNIIHDFVQSITLPERCGPSIWVLQSFASPEEAIYNTRLNLLLPLCESANGLNVSTWRLIWDAISRGAFGRTLLSALASHLVGLISSLHRSGFDVSDLFSELMGDSQGAVLICGAPLSTMKWDLALHGREIAERCAPDWWIQTKAILLSHPNNWSGDGIFSGPGGFVGELEAAANCHRCPEKGLVFRGTWRNPIRSHRLTYNIPPSPPRGAALLPEMVKDLTMPLEGASVVQIQQGNVDHLNLQPMASRRSGVHCQEYVNSPREIHFPQAQHVLDPSNNV